MRFFVIASIALILRLAICLPAFADPTAPNQEDDTLIHEVDKILAPFIAPDIVTKYAPPGTYNEALRIVRQFMRSRRPPYRSRF
jgi:hypothetical protein